MSENIRSIVDYEYRPRISANQMRLFKACYSGIMQLGTAYGKSAKLIPTSDGLPQKYMSAREAIEKKEVFSRDSTVLDVILVGPDEKTGELRNVPTTVILNGESGMNKVNWLAQMVAHFDDPDELDEVITFFSDGNVKYTLEGKVDEQHASLGETETYALDRGWLDEEDVVLLYEILQEVTIDQ